MQQFVEALSDFIARPCARLCCAIIKLMFVHWFVLLDRMQRGFQIKEAISLVFNSLQMLTQDLLKYCNRVKAQSAE